MNVMKEFSLKSGLEKFWGKLWASDWHLYRNLEAVLTQLLDVTFFWKVCLVYQKKRKYKYTLNVNGQNSIGLIS